MNVSSLAAIASGRLPAIVAPASSSGSARAAVRFHTVTAWPARNSARLSADPMTPVPTIVTARSDSAISIASYMTSPPSRLITVVPPSSDSTAPDA